MLPVFLLHVSEEGPKEQVLTVVQWVMVLDGAVLERNLGAELLQYYSTRVVVLSS
jgi:hypothetical protein